MRSGSSGESRINSSTTSSRVVASSKPAGSVQDTVWSRGMTAPPAKAGTVIDTSSSFSWGANATTASNTHAQSASSATASAGAKSKKGVSLFSNASARSYR
jgi:hypothetical protein